MEERKSESGGVGGGGGDCGEELLYHRSGTHLTNSRCCELHVVPTRKKLTGRKLREQSRSSMDDRDYY